MTRARWFTGAVRVGAGLLCAVLPLFAPPVREALVALERLIAPSLFLAALVLAAFDALRPSRAWLLAELRVSRWLGRWGWAAAILCFLVPVWAHWSFRPPGSAAALGALLGYIPWSDVHQHYEGARRLLADGAFGPYSERRPLNAALLSVRLAITGGDLRVAIGLQAALCAVCAWLLARAVALRRGLAASLGTFAVLLGLSRDFLPMAATEPLGIAFACLALAILLTPVARREILWAGLGLLALDTALRARPGAQFVVPAVMLWAVWVFRGRRWRALATVAAVALAGSLSTTALNAFYGSGQATFTTYPAYTLYGLSRHSNWLQAEADFGDRLETMGSEKQVARFLYARAWENMRRSPAVFAHALLRNLNRFLGKLPGNLSRVASLRPLFEGGTGPPTPPQVGRDVRAAAPLLLAGLLAWLAYLWRAPAEDRWLWIAVAVGLLASVPFVYGDAGFRGLAASYPLIATALGIGLGRRDRPPAVPRTQRALVASAGAVAVALLVLALAGPAVARLFWKRPGADLVRTADPGAIVMVPADSVSVVVTNLRRARGLELARVDRRDLTRMLEWAGLEPEQQAHIAQARTPYAVISAYDHAGRRQVLLLAPVEMLREGRAYLSVQAQPVPQSQLLEVVRWRRLDEPGVFRQRTAPAAEPEG